jgi:MFS family permease
MAGFMFSRCTPPRSTYITARMTAPVPFAVWRLASSGIAAVIGFALLIPYTAIRLEALGHSAAAIGFFAAVPWLAVLALAPFVAKLARAYGGATLYVQSALLSAPVPLAFALTESFAVWCLANFAIGLAAALRWIVSESWVADLVPAERRGRAIGLYETALGFSFMLGPLALSALDPSGPVPAYLGAALWLASWVFALGIPAPPQREGDTRARESGFRIVLLAVPAAVIGAAIGGAFEVGLAGIGVYWAIGLGAAPAQAAFFAAALGAGSFAAQYPAGWLADKYSLDKTVRRALGVLIAVSLAAPWLAETQAGTLAVAVVWGAAGGMLYTLAMIRVGHGFSGPALLRATAAVVSGYTIGGAGGPALIGTALEFDARFGLPLTLAGFAGAALFAHARLGRR